MHKLSSRGGSCVHWATFSHIVATHHVIRGLRLYTRCGWRSLAPVHARWSPLLTYGRQQRVLYMGVIEMSGTTTCDVGIRDITSAHWLCRPGVLLEGRFSCFVKENCLEYNGWLFEQGRFVAALVHKYCTRANGRGMQRASDFENALNFNEIFFMNV